MEKKLYELPTIVIFDLDKDDTIRTSGPLEDLGANEIGEDGTPFPGII